MTDTVARVFKYNGQTYADPGAEYTVQEVQKHLSSIFPEIAQAEVEEETLADGTLEITFDKRVGTKGAAGEDADDCVSCGERADGVECAGCYEWVCWDCSEDDQATGEALCPDCVEAEIETEIEMEIERW